MKILIAGSQGSIGKRYCAIVKHLGHEVLQVDPKLEQNDSDHGAQRVILATPTSMHLQSILTYKELGVPMLCEKPMLMEDKFDQIQDIPDLYMVCNYAYLIPKGAKVSYNYFHGGNENFAENFAQPLYIDPEAVIECTSPVFQLHYELDGHTTAVSTESLQQSYVDMIQDFINGVFDNLWTVHDGKAMFEVLKNHG